ncbi:MAG: trypsin-like peptidase domain-containing protein [Phycisphaerae bacterium]|nr:trypsin-like peptidase domain-containing protein [Phycisphaerae bacterium]
MISSATSPLTIARGQKGILPGVLLALLAAAPVLAQTTTMKPEVEDRVKRASIMIFMAVSEREKGDTPLGSGSGFFINGTGLAITNNHVVDPTHMKSPAEKQNFHYRAGRLTWTAIVNSGVDGEEKKYDAMVIYQNETADQALLQVYADDQGTLLKTPNYLRLLPESRLEERMPVWAFGFPGGPSQRIENNLNPKVSITAGNVLQYPRTPGGRIRMIYTDVIARPGNSGGAMVNADGYVLGAVTLMKAPEGREDTGGAKYSSLSPASISKELLHNAFVLGKVPAHTDVTPFMSALPRVRGRLNVPEYERLNDKDVLYFNDGDRIHGAIASSTITWPTSVGTLEVPVSAVAYIINNDEGSHLFLEGGNYLAATSNVKATIKFQPQGGEPTDVDVKNVAVIGFKTEDREISPVEGDVFVLDSDAGHLVVKGVSGSASFAGRIGAIQVKLPNLIRASRQPDGSTVVLMQDGRRMTGRFDAGKFEATIAATGTPIAIDLSGINWMTVREEHQQAGITAGSTLLDVLTGADDQVLQTARDLQGGDLAKARETVNQLTDSSTMKKFTDAKKDQVRLLEAVLLLREGRYDESTRAFRRVARADDNNLAAFASGYGMVLKENERTGYEFDGKPFSDRQAFQRAGLETARRVVAEARSAIKDARGREGKNRGEYARTIGDVKKYEDVLTGAAVFIGTDAEDVLVRLWKVAIDTGYRELDRLEKVEQEQQEDARGGSRKGRGSNLLAQREMDEIKRLREDTEETLRTYYFKRFDYGFRIEDPDIQALKEKKADV